MRFLESDPLSVARDFGNNMLQAQVSQLGRTDMKLDGSSGESGRISLDWPRYPVVDYCCRCRYLIMPEVFTYSLTFFRLELAFSRSNI